MRATLSVLGLYQYQTTLFDNLHIPDGVDRDTLIENLLAETAELEVLYSDGNMMETMIGVWSAKELRVWQDLLETLGYEYDPIENYNRYENWQDDGTTTNSNHANGVSDTTTRSGNATHNVDQTDVAGFNSEDFADRERVTTNGTNNATAEGTSSDESWSTGDGTTSSTHGGRIHGNIGVTTTQHMILEQREVVEFNIYDYIINSFKKRFCLLVY